MRNIKIPKMESRRKPKSKNVIITAIVLILMILTSCSSAASPAKEQWYLVDDPKRDVNIRWQSMWETYMEIPDCEKQDVKVAVIDTGADIDNPEIEDCLIINDDNVSDDVGHGTKNIGIICASQYKGNVVGIADAKHTQILPIKIMAFNDDKMNVSCSTKELIKAIEQAEENGCSICNISLNTDKDNPELKEIMSKSKMLFVVSAGNGNPRGRNIDIDPSYPASYDLDNMIVVANIKSNGRLNKTSNYGECVDIAAPGTEIYNISLDGEYDSGTGTSYAAPIVTGLAAMLYICDSDMTAVQCKKTILCSAEQGRRIENKVRLRRIVNLNNAMENLLITRR